MTISIVQRVSHNDPVSTSTSVTIATPVVGNWLIAFMKENGANAVTIPSGWSHTSQSPGAIGTRQLLCVYKKVGVSEPTTITFSNADSNNKLLTVWEVSGLHATTPEAFADLTGTVNGLTSKTLDTTGTLGQADNFVIAMADQALDNGGEVSVDSGFTLRDTGTFNFWMIADQITSATTALAPTFTWTTARASGGFMAVFRGATPATVTAPAGAATAAATAPVVKAKAALAPPAGVATAASTAPAVKAKAKVTAVAGAATAAATAPDVSGGVAEPEPTSSPPVADALPVVGVWEDQGAGVWALVGSIPAYDSLKAEPRFLDPAGGWEMVLPYDEAALSLLPDRLVSIDWRGSRTTWTVDRFNPASGEHGPTLTIGGPAALSMLGWDLAWPDPTADLDAQPEPPVQYSGPAETVIKDLVTDNFVTRRGGSIVVPTTAGLGASIKARARFDNLLELVTKKAKRGGVGVDLQLVNTTSSTRAELQLIVWVPTDKSLRVRLSEKIGTLANWSQTNTAPTATKALVGGAGTGVSRVFAEATSTDGDDAAAAWGGHRVVFVNGPTSYDAPELDEAGQEALDSGASTTNAALTAAESEGLQAFRDYNVGDKATGQLSTGLDVVDVISGIALSITSSGVDITPTFGDPSADDPLVSMAELIRSQRRRIRQLEQRS